MQHRTLVCLFHCQTSQVVTLELPLLLLWEYREYNQKVVCRKSTRVGIRLDLDMCRTNNVGGSDFFGGRKFIGVGRSAVNDFDIFDIWLWTLVVFIRNGKFGPRRGPRPNGNVHFFPLLDLKSRRAVPTIIIQR
jgi:hypothetical protein